MVSKGLVHYWSRINGKVKVRTALWSPQLSGEALAVELAKITTAMKKED
jgi:hypothetical protein